MPSGDRLLRASPLWTAACSLRLPILWFSVAERIPQVLSQPAFLHTRSHSCSHQSSHIGAKSALAHTFGFVTASFQPAPPSGSWECDQQASSQALQQEAAIHSTAALDPIRSKPLYSRPFHPPTHVYTHSLCQDSFQPVGLCDPVTGPNSLHQLADPSPLSTTKEGQQPAGASPSLEPPPSPTPSLAPRPSPAPGACPAPGPSPTPGQSRAPEPSPALGLSPCSGPSPAAGASPYPGPSPAAGASLYPGASPAAGASPYPGPSPAARPSPSSGPCLPLTCHAVVQPSIQAWPDIEAQGAQAWPGNLTSAAVPTQPAGHTQPDTHILSDNLVLCASSILSFQGAGSSAAHHESDPCTHFSEHTHLTEIRQLTADTRLTANAQLTADGQLAEHSHSTENAGFTANTRSTANKLQSNASNDGISSAYSTLPMLPSAPRRRALLEQPWLPQSRGNHQADGRPQGTQECLSPGRKGLERPAPGSKTLERLLPESKTLAHLSHGTKTLERLSPASKTLEHLSSGSKTLDCLSTGSITLEHVPPRGKTLQRFSFRGKTLESSSGRGGGNHGGGSQGVGPEPGPGLETRLRCAKTLAFVYRLSHEAESFSGEEAAAFVFGVHQVGRWTQSRSCPQRTDPATLRGLSLRLSSLAIAHAPTWDAHCLGTFLAAAKKLHLDSTSPAVHLVTSELQASNGQKVRAAPCAVLAHVCAACALFGLVDRATWELLRGLVLERIEELNPTQVSKVLWAFATGARWLNAQLLGALKQQFLQQIAIAQRRDCNVALLSLAKVRHRDVLFCDAVAKRLLAQAPALTNIDVASISYAMATLRYFNMDLFMCFADVLQNKTNMFTPSQLATLSWSCARLEHHHPPLLENLSRAALCLLPRFSCQDLASLAWSLVVLQHEDSTLFKAMAEQVESKMPRFNLMDLAMLAAAFSKFRPSTADSYRHLVQRLGESALPHMPLLRQPHLKGSAVALFGALARVQVYQPVLQDALVGALCAQQLEMKEAAQVLKGCMVLRYVDDKLVDHISRLHSEVSALAECRRAHGLRHMMTVLQLLVRLGCTSMLQEAAEKWAGKPRTKLATHYRVTVAWCHCMLGYKDASALLRALHDLHKRPDVYLSMEAATRRQLLHLQVKLQEVLMHDAPADPWVAKETARQLLELFPSDQLMQIERQSWIADRRRAKPRRMQLEVFRQLERMGLQPLALQPTHDELFLAGIGLKIGQQQVAVEALPVYCFARGPGSGRMLGMVQAELGSLSARGWLVRTVPYDEWVTLGSEDEKSEYLSQRLGLQQLLAAGRDRDRGRDAYNGLVLASS